MITSAKRLAAFLIFAAAFASAALGQAGPAVETGKPPVIIIPGITGSELVNSNTGKTVWFKASRAKEDDIRLPISPNLARNRDSLVAGDILREVQIARILPEVEIYDRLIDSLKKRGYREARWDAPGRDAHHDTFFIYPYDWRVDNVDSARRLVRQVESLKRRIGRPGLKFNVIAHSMGGLIARYAAMYGNSDIPAAPTPTWAGAKHFERIFLLGTPNEGSVSAFDALLNGMTYTRSGVNLPFIRDINRFDVFTTQSIFQLLPHEGTLQAYDEELKPVTLDLYDPATWEKYGWAIWQDKNFTKRFSAVEQRNARSYFRVVLQRAKRFHQALNATSRREIPVAFYLIGAECKDTQNAVIIRQAKKDGEWLAQFNAADFKRPSGEVVKSDALKSLIYSPGDGVVTKRSLAAETLISAGKANTLPLTAEILLCESHVRLVTNQEIQNKLFEYIGLAPAVQAVK